MKPLSPMETAVLELVVDQGLGPGRIAKRMGLAASTICVHLFRAREKLGARSTCQAAVLFDRMRRPQP